MNKLLALSIFLLLAGCSENETCCETDHSAVSDISSDEHVVFFRTSGWLNEAKQEWHLPIHGWIYEPQDSTARRAAFEEILEEQFDLAPAIDTEANFSRRLNLLLADNERGKTIVVNVAGRKYELPHSSENGHFTATLVVPAADTEQFADNGLIKYSAVTRNDDARTFNGEVRLVPPQGISIVSDIDDTVKITNILNKKSLLEYTFLLDFAAAPGMAQRYKDWSANGTSFHYVSSSPWQLYSPLSEFLDRENFPWSTFSLKAVRFRDETLFDLFKKGTETKPVAIEKILATYPDRKFVLIGDSGEQDPEVYAALIQKYPEQILSIFIRNVSQETADNERFQSVFADVDPGLWRLFEDPQSLSLPAID